MCGITGFLTNDASCLEDADAIVTKMALAIAHRGPDDAGAWVDLKSGVYLA